MLPSPAKTRAVHATPLQTMGVSCQLSNQQVATATTNRPSSASVAFQTPKHRIVTCKDDADCMTPPTALRRA